MTQIRVDADMLRLKADELSAAAERLTSLAEQVYVAAEGAPSYDGQFGPGAQAMGDEGRALLASKADRLATLSAELLARAEAFEAADREWQAAMAAISTRTWPSLNQVQWGTPGKEPPWWLVELIIGMFPFGDAYDILKELFRLITQGETDELILILALVGLAADIGWADLLAPDPADAANAGLALLKGLVRQIPAGPARDALQESFLRVLRNADEAPEFFGAMHQLFKHEEILTVLRENPRALAAVLDAGPEAMELLAKNNEFALELLRHGDDAAPFLKNAEALELLVDQGPEALEKLVQYGDEGADLIARYKDDMVEFLARTPDEAGDLAVRATEAIGAAERLAEVGLHSDEAAGLIETILDASVHGSGDRVVIGRFFAQGQGQGYVQEVLENGGIYFNTPPGIYADALGGNRAIMGEIDREFLRRQLQSGIDRIELTGESIGEVLAARPDSFTALELRLLAQEASNYGYKLQGDVWVLVGR
jgi:hypothetical protein